MACMLGVCVACKTRVQFSLKRFRTIIERTNNVVLFSFLDSLVLLVALKGLLRVQVFFVPALSLEQLCGAGIPSLNATWSVL